LEESLIDYLEVTVSIPADGFAQIKSKNAFDTFSLNAVEPRHALALFEYFKIHPLGENVAFTYES
jgi:hypothetical protein